MEGLFMPIFQKISERENFQFHVMQFTWADESRNTSIRKAAEKMGIHYTAQKVNRKPVASIGSFLTAASGTKKIKEYIWKHQIDMVMPRSTFPAMMVNRLKGFEGQIIFDADGLPIEERVDFAGLKKGSWMYNFLKSAETQMLKNADTVITRSQKAIEIHLENIGKEHLPKFSVVQNGRNTEAFRYDPEWRQKIRKELGIQDEYLMVYAGSLGPQYCLPEMLEIFEEFAKSEKTKFLILTGNLEFAEQHIPVHLKADVLLKKVRSDEVPAYLNAAHLGFALREPAFSMKGVAPIKLGEYLLCGLPVIASKGIGDTEEILANFENCFLYEHSESMKDHLSSILEFLKMTNFADKSKISEKAKGYFSLEAAAESYIKAIKTLA